MRPLYHRVFCRAAVAMAVIAGVMTSLADTASAQRTGVHYFQRADMPPGSIGRSQLLRGGPLPGYFQPVQVRVPAGVMISVSADGQYSPAQRGELLAGMLIGSVYRLRVSNIPLNETQEVYPTIEVINRLHPPPGQEVRFPIPIEITQEEIEMAISGRLVTRVIYLEDPTRPFPMADDPQRQRSFDVRASEDPLQVADELGRPMAILRMGSRVPDGSEGTMQFGYDYGAPPVMLLEKPIVVPRDAGLEPVETAPQSLSPAPRQGLRLPRKPASPGSASPLISKRTQVDR